MTTIGSKKQENKLEELSKIANELHPEVEQIKFKGALRVGARKAVEKSRFETWEEITYEPAETRKAFFASLLEESFPYFQKLIGDENAVGLVAKLKEKNEKYLQD